jgi:3-hydroxybutyryl-CoA dehydrogenase
MTISSQDTILVVGAGIMGAGIAQIAAQAGHPVLLFDARPDAAVMAKDQLAKTLETLVAKGKMSATAATEAIACIEPIPSLAFASAARVAIEAIVERLDAKRALFADIEAHLAADAILATNTSSISVTAIANGMRHPERLVGMHFFNPVLLMRLVEVVSGLQTSPEVADAIFELGRAWRKVPVHAKSTPGFIVNRIARPYYAETLALLQERAATPEIFDACLRGAGFKMGPCELMDLIGHDTNFSVTQSVFEANFYDKRFVPGLVQRDLVDGGLLGRKTGRGFYIYPRQAELAHESPAVPDLLAPKRVVVHGNSPTAHVLAQLVAPVLTGFGLTPERNPQSAWTGIEVDAARLTLTDGRTAHELTQEFGIGDVAVFDRILNTGTSTSPAALAYAIHREASPSWKAQADAWLAALGFAPQLVEDTPGLVVARTVAMLVNEAADAVQQGVCSSEGADIAMKLGVNYPAGPFEWLAGWDARGVIVVIEALDAAYRGERYRVSPWLRRQV